ncbi:uncharacterized protein LOC144434069 [Glandiceps talaboti]
MADYMDHYHTHPDEMRGASRQKQNALMNKQIASFEKLVQHGISKFSKERLHRMLTEIAPTDTRLTSFRDLRHLIEITAKSRKLSQTDSDIAQISKYFNAFFNDIEHLRKMKSNFDERIYSVLYEFFYDPVVEDIISSKKDMEKGASQSRRKGDILKRLNRFSVGDQALSIAAFEELLQECEDLSATMAELKDLDQQWQMLLDDDDIDGNIFDDESLQELAPFANYKHFEHIFRFVPDVLGKSYNATELGKRWWISAEKIHNLLHRNKESRESQDSKADDEIILESDEDISLEEEGEEDEEVDEDMSGNEADDELGHNEDTFLKLSDSENGRYSITDLEDRLQELLRNINKHEQDLKVQKGDLTRLLRREARVTKLAGNLEEAVTTQESVLQQIKDIAERKENMKTRIGKCKKDTKQYRDLSGKLAGLEKNLQKLKHSSSYHDFQHTLYASDLDVELEVQPSMIRFVGDVQDKIRNLELCLTEEKSEKRRVEKELVLLKTNNDDVKARLPDSADSKSKSRSVTPKISDSESPTFSDASEKNRPNTSATVILSKNSAGSRKSTSGKSTGSDDPIAIGGTAVMRRKARIHHRKTDSGGGSSASLSNSDKLVANNNNDSKRKDENNRQTDKRKHSNGDKSELKPNIIGKDLRKSLPQQNGETPSLKVTDTAPKKKVPPRMYDKKRDDDVPSSKRKTKGYQTTSSQNEDSTRRQSRIPVRS